MPPPPKDVGEVHIQLPGSTTLTTDRSATGITAAIGRSGRIIAARTVSRGTIAKRGQIQIQVFLLAASTITDKARYRLLSGYVYENFDLAGAGSLPIGATDVLLVNYYNALAGVNIDIEIAIVDEDGTATSWRQEVDPRSDGVVRSIALGNPAAGLDFADVTVPTNAAWKLLSFDGTLVTGIAAPGRTLIIGQTDAAGVFSGGSTVPSSQGASTTTRYVGGVTSGPGAGAQGATVGISMPSGRMLESQIVRFITTNLAAADDWGAGQMLVEETIEP